ncbi:MAG: hypothetical protein KDA93_20195 [Planctomycetaceae bacterium]|nr:hypothetical protein [Planctomycetaceae bacterium]
MRTACILFLLLLCGCEARRQSQSNSSTFAHQESQYVLTVLLDMSGSFQHEMTDGGKAHRFNMRIIDRYFRDRLGNNDQLVIAQISGESRTLLWQGTPLQLRKDFPSATAFGEFLKSKSDPHGSLVHDAIASTVDYILADPNVSNGTAKSALFVLSDLADTSSSPESKERALQSLAAYGQAGGVVGLYYVDQSLVPEWRTNLRLAGVQESCVEADIVGTPNLPSFE